MITDRESGSWVQAKALLSAVDVPTVFYSVPHPQNIVLPKPPAADELKYPPERPLFLTQPHCKQMKKYAAATKQIFIPLS
ncbi:MAG: hypothetical protein CL581_16990 [Alteromonadaceae bacterium]|nr:hypothetical protein [Alteromonadaceae bacterium]MBH85312.1 hypothetical protein [Alteromonadaceae bacterium]